MYIANSYLFLKAFNSASHYVTLLRIRRIRKFHKIKRNQMTIYMCWNTTCTNSLERYVKNYYSLYMLLNNLFFFF